MSGVAPTTVRTVTFLLAALTHSGAAIAASAELLVTMLWSIMSGIFGAAASSMIKLATSSSRSSSISSSTNDDDDTNNAGMVPSDHDYSSPLIYVQHYVCDQHPWLSDLDNVFVNVVHRILGDLAIKYRFINLMPQWKVLKDSVLDLVATRFPYLFEVDTCQLVIMLPLRILCIVSMVLLNAYMLASFLKGIQESGSVVGTALSTASNFVASAALGALVWHEHERMNRQWYLGFACVLLGVVLLANVQSNDDDQQQYASNKSETTTRQNANCQSTKTTGKGSSSPSTPQSSRNGTFSNEETIPKPKVSVREAVSSYNSRKKKTASTESPIASPPPPKIKIRQPEEKSALISKTKVAPSKVIVKKPKDVKPVSALHQYYDASTKKALKWSSKKQLPLETPWIERGFLNECILCEGQLFDTATGASVGDSAVADLSCFHVVHSSCLKQAAKSLKNACPICTKPLAVFTSTKQAASCSGFWLSRIEACLLAMDSNGPPMDPATGKPQCLPASAIRDYFAQQPESILTTAQKQYIQDDPSGMDKGLQAALEWGGCRDYNNNGIQRGRVGYEESLRTRGIWKYDSKKDDLWLWEWGEVHPRHRCDQCQLSNRPLVVHCEGCTGSSQAAVYCCETCAKRDWQRHKQTCQKWQSLGLKT